MRVLFIGDVVGRGGRQVVRQKIREVQERERIDFTVANVENAAGGFGITPSLVEELLRCGIDVLTSGNHIWDKKEILEYFDHQPRLLRPANYPPGVPGHSVYVGSTPNGLEVAVVNLQGRVFMPLIDCPFRAADRILAELQARTPRILIDFHAEATSEKMAFGWYVDGRVSAVLGTHTHVPTADARVLPGGTAYISDVGMTGSYDSVIGMKVEGSLSRFLTGLPSRFEAARENPRLCAVVVELEEQSGKALQIRRLET